MQTFNEVLNKKRKEKGLTLRQASKKIGVFSSTLKNAELGYYPLSPKARKKASELYECDLETLYNETYAYTKPIKTKQKSLKLEELITKIFQHIATKIVLIVLLCFSFVLLGINAYYRNEAFNNPRGFADPAYLTLYDSIINSGKEVAEYPGYYSYSETYVDGSANLAVYQDKSPYKFFFYGNCVSAGGNFELVYNSAFSAIRLNTNYFMFTGYSSSYKGSFERTGENSISGIKYYQYVGTDWKVVDPESETFSEIDKVILGHLPNTDANINKAIKSLGVEGSVYHLTDSAINSYNQIVQHKMLLKIYINFAVIFGLILLLLCSFWDVLKKVFTKNGKNKLQDATQLNFVNYHKAPLPKDIKFFPPIKERWEQLIGLVFLLIAGIGIVTGVSSVLEVWGVPSSESLQNTAFTLAQFLPISIILLLYNKLDMYTKKDDVSKTVISFILLGILFYILEILTIFVITEIDVKGPEIISKLLSLILPGNFFFGMALYATMAMFLFTMPKICNTKKKQILWRCGIIIPIAYFVIGYILTYTKQMFGFTISPYIQCFFFSKDMTITLFAFGLLGIKFFMQRYVFKKYGKENGKLFITGNRYSLYFNILTAILLSLIMLCCILIPSWVKGDTELTLTDHLYNFVLLPLIIFCAHRKEDRTLKNDLWYLITYSLLIAIPIVICAGAIVEKISQIIF